MLGPQNPFSSRKAGFVAVSLLVLITLVCGLRLSLPIGLAGAVTTYLAVSLLLRRPAENFSPTPSAADLLAELTTLSQRIAAHTVRLKLGAVITQARTLLNHLQNQPDATTAQREFARDCLASTVAATRRFTNVASHVTEPTDAAILQFTAFLTALTQALGRAHEDLQAGQTADPAAQIDRYQTTLRGIIQTYFGS